MGPLAGCYVRRRNRTKRLRRSATFDEDKQANGFRTEDFGRVAWCSPLRGKETKRLRRSATFGKSVMGIFPMGSESEIMGKMPMPRFGSP
jgi:hypothetical protein